VRLGIGNRNNKCGNIDKTCISGLSVSRRLYICVGECVGGYSTAQQGLFFFRR
jgi:hypothetical protein